MKRHLVTMLSISLLASSALFAVEKGKEKEAIQNIEFIKKTGFSIKDFKDIGDIYAVNASHPRVPKATLFVTKDFKNVVIGQGFTSTGAEIDFPIVMEQYKKEAAYTIGNGKNEYYLFTDPECPYCKKFEQMSNNLHDDIKLHVFFFPLDFHQNAKAMSKYILAQKSNELRAKAMKDIADGKENYKTIKLSDADDKKFNEVISRHLKIGQEIGVNGTPAVFDAKGKPIQWPNLLKNKQGLQ